MFLIPGFLVSILTFPGVIVHQIAHRFFIDKANIPVYSVCYFRFGDPAGYIIHGSIDNLKSAYLISVGPLIMNSVLCMLVTLGAALPIVLGAGDTNPANFLLMWVGLSIGMHTFPSDQAVKSLVDLVKGHKGGGALYFLFAKIFSVIVKIANRLRYLWFDLIYALLLILAMPYLLITLAN